MYLLLLTLSFSFMFLTAPPTYKDLDDEMRAYVKEAAVKVVELCKLRGVSVSGVAMRFCYDYEHVASTLVGMSKQRHVEQNLRVLGTQNDTGLLAEIEELVAPVKNRIWATGRAENQD